MSKSKISLIVFLIAGLGEILSVIIKSPAHFFFKPLIVLALIGYYIVLADQKSFTLLGALLFCWMGDCLLMFAPKAELFFTLGLVAFLIGHVFYIFSFRQFVLSHPSTLLPTQKVRYLFPVFLAGTGLIIILYPGLGALRIPVIIYATVLMIMVSTALLRVGRTSIASFAWVFIGAACFMISDSILAVNKFYSSFAMANIPIMLTYLTAQFGIVKGLLSHEEK